MIFIEKPLIRTGLMVLSLTVAYGDFLYLSNMFKESLKLSHSDSDLLSRLDLPPYPSEEIMCDKLTQAVEETCGFAVE